MSQNYNNTDQNESGSQALVKSNDNGHALTVKGKGRLLALTDSILKSAIASRKANQLVVDDSWMQEIWDWADTFEISEEQVPRNRESLLGLTSLDIGSNYLTEISDCFSNLSNLTSISISDNRLSEIPEWIGNLSNLTSLDISANQLSEIPEWIGNLTNLTELNLGSNGLSELPESIGQLVNLQSIHVNGNNLKELPESIDQLNEKNGGYYSDDYLYFL